MAPALTSAADVLWHETLDSTNEEARRLIDSGSARPLWIAARAQTQGRGRLGRGWASPDGNLFASRLTPLPDMRIALRLPLAIGLAVARTADRFIPTGRAQLKWPNDVRVDEAKLSGVLVETWAMPGGPPWAVIGVGVNVATAPGVNQAATCLQAEGASPALTPELVLEALAGEVDRVLAEVETGFAGLLEHWGARCDTLGRRVRVMPGGQPLEGVFEGLEPDGAMRLRLDDGRATRVTVGDVSVVQEKT